MSKRIADTEQTKRAARDKRILAAWQAHDNADVSTERLLSMVGDATGAGADEIVTVIERAGLLRDTSLF